MAAAAAFVASLVAGSARGAEISPLGPEAGVNIYTTADQHLASVAAAADGRFVVSWQSYGQDESDSGVFARTAAANGTLAAGELQVNLASAGYQDAARVAAGPDGDFVVVWQHETGEENVDVRARLFHASGQPASAEIAVNTTTAGNQSEPTVAVDPTDGDFVVAWTHAAAADTADTDVRARRFDAAGHALGGEFRVNDTATGLQLAPAVVTLPSGGFAVAWQSLGQDGDGWGVYLEGFAADGGALGGEARVNLTTSNDQVSPAMAVAADGRLVVAWDSFGQDGAQDGVFARLFSAAVTPATGEVAVNTTTAGRQSLAAVAYLEHGPLVAWRSTDQDGDGAGIFARLLTADGAPASGEVRLNATIAGTQTAPSVAPLSATRFVAAWSSQNVDGDGLAIIARRFQTAPAASACAADATTLCLEGGRFRLRAQYRTATGAQGSAQAVALTPDTGYFWFFAPTNVELLVKVLDGCAVNGQHWVFAGGLTNVEVTMTAYDTATGAVRTYVNPQGTALRPVQDTAAFASCP
jgi:hypothetical protein